MNFSWQGKWDGEIDRRLSSSAVFTIFVYAVEWLGVCFLKVMEHPKTVNKKKKKNRVGELLCVFAIYLL